VPSKDNHDSGIEFQGRKAKRADSRERRRAILDAALRIIVREGIRGIRHRAVATEANVPLAATTYYFKDINELVSDAFNLFAENSLTDTQQLSEDSFRTLEQFSPEQLQESNTRELIAQGLIDLVVNHIASQVGDRDQRILEHAFRNEALRNEQLAKYAAIPQRRTLEMIEKFFSLLNSPDPQADAEIVNGVIMQLEYSSLTGSDKGLTRRAISRIVRKLLDN